MTNFKLRVSAFIALFNMYCMHLIDHAIKSLITIVILFTFISVFIFNLQIQDFNTKGNIIGSHSIVQVDLLLDNLKAYFLEQ